MKLSVENQGLKLLHYAIMHMHKKTPPSPTHPARWHDFCRQDPRFFYTLCKLHSMHNKNCKVVENQGFASLCKSLCMHYAVFMQTEAVLKIYHSP